MQVFHDLGEGLRGCDVVIMLRLQNERMSGALLPSAQEFYKAYGLTPEKLALAKPDAIVMHPGPINRGVEIDSAVADGPQSVIMPQVTYGIAVRMAVMAILAGERATMKIAYPERPRHRPVQRRATRSPTLFIADGQDRRDRRRAGRLPRRPHHRRQRPRRLPRPGRPVGAAARAGLRIPRHAGIGDAGGRRGRRHRRSPARRTPTRRSTSRGWSRCSSAAPRTSTGRACTRWARSRTGSQGKKLTEMAELAEAGCVAFSQADAPLDRHARAAARDALCRHLRLRRVAAAAGSAPRARRRRARRRGRHAPGPAGHPGMAETVALHAILDCARDRRAGAPLRGSPRARRRPGARSQGARAWPSPATSACTTCTCATTTRRFQRQHAPGAAARSPRDRDALRARRCADGTIDAVCSDHTPVDDDAKQVPFGEAEPGATGLELLLPLALKWGAK